MRFYKFLIVVLMIVSCKKEAIIEVPECLLTEEEMVDAMVEVTILKATKSLGRQGLKDSGIKPLEYLFSKHGIDTVTIRENFEYYNKNYDKSRAIFDSISEKLKRKELLISNEIDSAKAAKKRKKDSLKEEESEEESDSENEDKKDSEKEDSQDKESDEDELSDSDE